MQFLRSGQHDDRRRRLLSDEASGGPVAAASRFLLSGRKQPAERIRKGRHV